MQRKQPVIAILLGLSGTVSACNSTDMLYSQGPWGPAHVRRNYPEYSAPWGRPIVVTTQDAVDGPVAVYPDVPAIDAPAARTRRYEVFAEVDMPPAPGFGDLKAPADPLLDPPAISAPSSPPAGSQATAPIQASPPGVFASPKRASSYAGSWKATIGSSSCKVQLSSVPSLDLYKASTQGCSAGRHARRERMELPRRSGRSLLARTAGSPPVRRRSLACRNAEQLKRRYRNDTIRRGMRRRRSISRPTMPSVPLLRPGASAQKLRAAGVHCPNPVATMLAITRQT